MRESITFLRLRPASVVNELWAATRRREGTTAVEVEHLDEATRAPALGGGLAPVSLGPADAEPMAWVLEPGDVAALIKQGTSGWRITVVDNSDRAAVLDALARSRAAFVRTGRSRVEEIAELVGLPGIAARVSVFVDTPAEAVRAVVAGARDLLLRGWTTDALGEMRLALEGYELIERGALPIGVTVDEARSVLPGGLFTAYLHQIDGSGAIRPRYEWAPGMDVPAPVPEGRLSAQWADEAWVDSGFTLDMDTLDSELAGILERSLDGSAPTRDEVERLFRARGDEVDAIAVVADRLRERANGGVVTYVVNRNINYTNQCTFRCGFCAFSKGPRSLNLRGEPYLMSIPQVVERAVEAWDRGATEVCLQGGIHPDFTGDFYVTVVESIKEYLPGMHIHGFTPLEVWQGAETLGVPVPRLPDPAPRRRAGDAAGHGRRDSRRHRACPPLPGQDPYRPVGGGDDHRSRVGSALDRNDHVRTHRLACSVG